MKVNHSYDVVIVGTGAAGLFTALHLKSNMKVLMITKDKLENSDSYLAQGGICTLLDENDYKAYFEDTMKAGRYENNKDAVDVMISSSRAIIDDLIGFGVDFDYNKEGAFSYTREGAHSAYRILHHKDVTGKEITSKLIAGVKKRKNITIQTFTTMVDLYIQNNRCEGIVIEHKNQAKEVIIAKSVVLATGGIGGLFQNSTNFSHITGDSFALAIKHKIALEHLNYIQIHPTVLYSKRSGRRFLISESVRGEGAYLLNEEKKRFVNELLPRDVVTDAIKKEMERFCTDHVYLSVKHLPVEVIKGHFPNIYKRCLLEGYDLCKEDIPVTPAQHYIMGGIKVTLDGKTSMEGLYAVGETACNGVHGANRLASNSLLESLVFAKRTANVVVSTTTNTATNNMVSSTLDLKIKYPAKAIREYEYRKLLMSEISRKDEDFYDKWCNDENKCG